MKREIYRVNSWLLIRLHNYFYNFYVGLLKSICPSQPADIMRNNSKLIILLECPNLTQCLVIVYHTGIHHMQAIWLYFLERLCWKQKPLLRDTIFFFAFQILSVIFLFRHWTMTIHLRNAFSLKYQSIILLTQIINADLTINFPRNSSEIIPNIAKCSLVIVVCTLHRIPRFGTCSSAGKYIFVNQRTLWM
jgi:hypothetical protein